MNKKIIGIFICTLLIITAVFPLVNAININTYIKKNKNELVLSDRPKLWVSIPDAHIYSEKPFIDWGSVEFDNPGAVIDVDISGVEGDEFLLGISQNIIINYENQFFPLCVIYSIEGKSMSTQPLRGDYNQTSAWLLIDKVESFYPIKIWVTGVPFILVGYLSFYWLKHMLNPDLPMEPSELELKYGTSAEYQLHFIIK